MPGGKPFQSKLIPHLELIQRLRQQRLSYPEISKILEQEHGLKVGATTIFDFVKVRSKRSDVYTIAADLPSPPPADPSQTAQDKRREKLAAAKVAIAARRQAAEQAAAAPEESGWEEFQRSFDPAKPLKLILPESSTDRPNETR